MKKLLIFIFALAMALCISVPASALYIVDIGNLASESPYNLSSGWSNIWDENAQGFFGNWGGGPDDGDATWRTVGTGTIADPDLSAFITLDFGPLGATMNITHLEGIAVDSFQIWSTGTDPSILFNFDASTEDYDENEVWLTSSFDVALMDTQTIKFISTGAPWSGYDTYGQVAISSITVDPIPEPGTILLLGIGLLGLAGFGRKKFFKK